MKVDWWFLSYNQNAIHILEENMGKISWFWLSNNPNAILLLARLNTEKMRENCKHFAEELAAYVFRPVRLVRICKKYMLEFDEYFEQV